MDDFTLGDVFELAALIGQEMEEMIRRCGQESVEKLMPNVVKILEQLESLTEKKQRDATFIEELKIEKEKLVIENRREHALKRQLQEKVDYFESIQHDDVNVYEERLLDLKDQNNSLREQMEDREEELLNQTAELHDGDVEMMLRMKTTIDEQRDTIRQLKIEVDEKVTELDAFQQQIMRLIDINERLRLYNEQLRIKVDAASTMKADAQARLTMEEADGHVPDMIDGICGSEDVASTTDGETSESPEPTEADKSTTKKDPNRPRYTLTEMQQVLAERNRYKEMTSCLEDELALYKPRQNNNNNNKQTNASLASSPTKKSFSIWRFFPKRASHQAQEEDANCAPSAK